jgi:hypothetical protein
MREGFQDTSYKHLPCQLPRQQYTAFISYLKRQSLEKGQRRIPSPQNSPLTITTFSTGRELWFIKIRDFLRNDRTLAILFFQGVYAGIMSQFTTDNRKLNDNG